MRMKVILSRKGFDSTAGGYPSPIIDGMPLSLPIPDKNDKIKYSDLEYNNGKSYLDIIADLGMNKYDKNSACHFDPNINLNLFKNKNWRGSVGQINQAQKHLENQGIGVGDIFLFFGWFKETEEKNGKISFVKKNKYPDGFHLIWGYMEIGQIYNTATQDVPEWLHNYPHFVREDVREAKSNTIYVASEKLALDQKQAGFGILPFSEKLILTKEHHPRSCWDLNKLKELRDLPVSYHNDNSWKDGYFQSAGRGQEFVIKDKGKDDTRLKNWVMRFLKS